MGPTRFGGLLHCATVPLTIAARYAFGPLKQGAELYRIRMTIPDALCSYGSIGVAWYVYRIWASSVAIYRGSCARRDPDRPIFSRVVRLTAMAGAFATCWTMPGTAAHHIGAPIGFIADLVQIVKLDLAPEAPMHGMPILLNGLAMGFADGQQQKEWAAHVASCKMRGVSVAETWKPLWNQRLGYVQLAHLGLLLYYFGFYGHRDETPKSQKDHAR